MQAIVQPSLKVAGIASGLPFPMVEVCHDTTFVSRDLEQRVRAM
jgi:hypothetical protein